MRLFGNPKTVPSVMSRQEAGALPSYRDVKGEGDIDNAPPPSYFGRGGV